MKKAKAVFDLFLGEEIKEKSERQFLAALKRDLSRTSLRDSLVFANFGASSGKCR